MHAAVQRINFNIDSNSRSSLQVVVGIQLNIPTIFNIHNDAAILTAVGIQLQNSRRKIYNQSSLTATCIHQHVYTNIFQRSIYTFKHTSLHAITVFNAGVSTQEVSNAAFNARCEI